jgi:hypothetical protein
VASRWFPSLLALEITVPRWPAHDIRQLIREMSIANPLWGAPRIHGELLKLGIAVGQTTERRRPPSQGWKTFLRNHADGIASMDREAQASSVPEAGILLSSVQDLCAPEPRRRIQFFPELRRKPFSDPAK